MMFHRLVSGKKRRWRHFLLRLLDRQAVSESGIIMISALVVGTGAGFGAVFEGCGGVQGLMGEGVGQVKEKRFVRRFDESKRLIRVKPGQTGLILVVADVRFDLGFVPVQRQG